MGAHTSRTSMARRVEEVLHVELLRKLLGLQQVTVDLGLQLELLRVMQEQVEERA